MKHFVRPVFFALAFLTACSSGQPATPPPVPPVITAFTADKTEVTTGTAVKLSFTTERATSVSLIDQTGTEIAITGKAEAGEATVNPTQTSFYVLRATGEGGKDSAFVQVAVNEGLKQVFLIAVPAEVNSGDVVTVAWSAAGGSNITLKDNTGATLSMAESGTLTLKPARSNEYVLSARGEGNLPLTQTASVKVRPVVKSFTADPPAAKQGEKMTLSWVTAGAESVTVSERSFGTLFSTSTTATVDQGSFELIVPSDFNADAGEQDAGTLPDGGAVPPPGARPVPDNFPLTFTLTAATAMPAQNTTATLDSFVRNGPVIATFVAPDFVSENKPVNLSWTVTNGFRSELFLDGARVLATVPPATANGSFTYPSLAADLTVTLVAFDFNGLSVRQTKTIKVARLPKVNTFTLPTVVASAGAAAAATWTTTNATSVVIRIKDGPPEYLNTTAAQVASGSTMLHPARTTTYVLEAYNLANDKDVLEKTVTVTTPITASATPNPTAPNGLVVLSWDVTGVTPADVIGLPAEPPASTNAPASFVDIESAPGAKKLVFTSTNDQTVPFTVASAGFSFPVVGNFISTFSASTNGFLALASTTTSTAANVDLKGTASLPAFAMLAPFWDDLDLGTTGSVWWKLDGTTFPRRLIVQWNKVRIAGDAMSELTFEVQLYETGELRYVYKTLQDSMSKGQGGSATVGVYFGTIFKGQFSLNTNSLSQDLELKWFTDGAQTGVRPVIAGTTSFATGFFYKSAAGAYVYVSTPVRVFGAGSVVVNEAMPQPDATLTEGSYVELANPSGVDLDVSGLELSTVSNPMATFVLPPNTTLKKSGFLVAAQNPSSTSNGGVTADLGYGSALVMTAADTLKLRVIGSLLTDGGVGLPFDVSQLAWTASTPGTAIQKDPALGGGIPSCTRTQTYGPLSQLGTPGLVNESCFPYTLTPITAAFEDISATGTGLLTANSSGYWDEVVGTATLTMPFRYFGAPTTTLSVSSNGWLSVKTETSSVITNKTAPGSGSPIGAISPYWDDLINNEPLGPVVSNAYSGRVGDHHIIQWNHVSPYRQLSAPRADNIGDLNFEAKLFDDGAIEFHFAGMTEAPNGSATSPSSTGSSATVWIEMPDGGGALPISINTPGIVKPGSAWRFTPKP